MKILLLEDDPLTTEFLAHTLSSHRYAVDTIADGATGLEMASRWHYDLLILDWMLPSMNGLEVCRQLRAQGSRTPILMLTVKDSNDDIVAGLDAGADDYLAKSCDATQLLARVRALMRRTNNITTAPVLQWGHLRLDPAQAQVTYQGQPISCRPKEYELLELFLRNPQRMMTRSAIIDHLWPLADTPVEGSVTNLIKDLRHRLKVAGLPASPIETVYGLGYRLKAEAEAPGSKALLTPPPPPAEGLRGPSLAQTLQQVTQRFQASLTHRLAVLEQAVLGLQAGTLSPQARQDAWVVAHKLAGGLGLFGYGQASAAAEALEHLLKTHPGPDPALAQHLAAQLESLKLALAHPQPEGLDGDSPPAQPMTASMQPSNS